MLTRPFRFCRPSDGFQDSELRLCGGNGRQGPNVTNQKGLEFSTSLHELLPMQGHSWACHCTARGEKLSVDENNWKLSNAPIFTLLLVPLWKIASESIVDASRQLFRLIFKSNFASGQTCNARSQKTAHA